MAQTIPVLVAPAGKGRSAARLTVGDHALLVKEDIDVEKLKTNLDRLLSGLQVALANPKSPQAYPLKEISVALEISTEGGVRLIGSLTVGVTAGITLTFAKPEGS